MKKNIHACLLGIITVLFCACHADVDIKNIDTTSHLDMDLALPLGSTSITLGDILGAEGAVKQIRLDENGVFYFLDTFSITRTYRNIDVTSYNSVSERLFRIQQVNPAITNLNSPVDVHMTLPFDVSCTFDEFNNTEIERIDSVDVIQASFTSTINPYDLPGFSWDWVNNVKVLLGDRFSRVAGKELTVYEKGVTSSINGFNQPIIIDIDHFTLNFIKDPNKVPSIDNVVDAVNMQLVFDLTIPAGQNIPVNINSGFKYTLGLSLLDFNAIWGRFKPSSEMHDADTIKLEDVLPFWKDLQRMKLPFSDPSVELQITTKIAGNLDVAGEFIFAATEGQLNNPTYAEFDGQHSKHYIWNTPQTTVNIDRKTLGDSITNSIFFDNTAGRGHIDRLFAIRPDYVGYKFAVTMYQPESAPYEIRLCKDNNINVDAIINMPFRFNEGMELSYSDTIRDLDLTNVDLDNLISEVDIIEDIDARNVELVILAENMLPAEVKAEVKFLDEYLQPVQVKNEDGEWVDLEITQNNALTIAAPTYSRVGGNTIPTAGKSKLIIGLNKEQFNQIKKVKNIVFKAQIDDESLRQQKQANSQLQIYPIQFTEDAGLKLHVGLDASVGATINLNDIINSNQD